MNVRIDLSNARPVVIPLRLGQQYSLAPCRPARELRARRGLAAHYSGLEAEETATRHYRARGATIRERRLRTPEGELDLIVSMGDVLVFVEVKKRKHSTGPDLPVSARQWRRLENAAEHYMMQTLGTTGIRPVFRFDVALIDGAGQVTIIENAREAEEF